MTSEPVVSVAIPALNEEHYIESCIRSLLPQIDQRHSRLFVVDGGSSDRTVEIVTRLQAAYPCVILLHNSKRNQAAAINLAARAMPPSSKILIRADAHSTYPTNFIVTLVQALKQHNATSVVVPMKTVGRAPMQRAIATAQNSRMGNGGSAHRLVGLSRFVDHGHHAAFDADFFHKIGGYDESFTVNEDAEFDHRSLLNGGRIWLSCEAAITYYPRATLISLARQYYNFGRGRAKTLLAHNIRPKLRQLLPLVLTGILFASLSLSPIFSVFLIVPVAIAALYGGYSVVSAVGKRDGALLWTGPAAFVMHVCWASGFIVSCLSCLRNRTSRHPPLDVAAP
jgi:succinoglycan biosynthesis protein ExoA